MPTIPNFPQSLLDEHKEWHDARHNFNINPPIGYGLEFLQYHRDFIARALAWYHQNGNDPRLVEAWVSVPEPIRQTSCYNQEAEARILFQPESFASADELGRFIESSNIHSCIHREAATLYGDPAINDFDTAPRNTVFYNIHGMVDRWWRNWEGLGRFGGESSYWCGSFEGESEEVLYYSPNDGKWWLGKSSSRKDFNKRVIVAVEWSTVGESRHFGPMNDGRLFRVWDLDGDGKLEVLFRHPIYSYWVEGKVKDGRIAWQPIRLQPRGLPSSLD